MGDMKTTLEIPDALYRQVKIRAAREGVKIKDVVARALAAEFHPVPKPITPAKKEKRGSIFPIFKGPLGPLLEGKDIRSLSFLDEQDDLERLKRAFRR